MKASCFPLVYSNSFQRYHWNYLATYLPHDTNDCVIATGFQGMLEHLSSMCDWHHSYSHYLPSMKKISAPLDSLHLRLSTLLIFILFFCCCCNRRYRVLENLAIWKLILVIWNYGKGIGRQKGSHTVPERSMLKKPHATAY